MTRTRDDLHFPAGELAAHDYEVLLTPERAGWNSAGLKVVRLAPQSAHTFETGSDEALVLPLSGSATVVSGDFSCELVGRESVFERVSDFAYFPPLATVTLASVDGGEFAIPTACAQAGHPAAYCPASAVPVETRGAGQSSRQVTNFCAPDTWPADRISAVEVLTPAGNWSSYPPHKHDTLSECEAALEEIYYFRVESAGDEPGFACHRTYDLEEGWDITQTVRDGDVFLVPRGYHGPSMAAPGYHLYYLNVLAGVEGMRSMAFCDDPAHHWVRGQWDGMEVDPRVPMTSADGRITPPARIPVGAGKE